ncbi:hypothetical protein [Bacillus sp. AK128]
MEFLSIILKAMLISFIELFYLFGVIITVGFIIGWIERKIHTYLVRAFGPRGILLTAWIGTPIHELGHLVQCFIWGHRVKKVKLLQVHAPNGVLGYVEHQYNLNSLYHQVGNFFIGIGPIISGIGSLILGMYVFIPEAFQIFTASLHQNITIDYYSVEYMVWSTLDTVILLMTSMFTLDHLFHPLFWIYLVLAMCISSHMALSKQDIKGSARGLLTIFMVLVLIKLGAGLLGFDSHLLVIKVAEYNAYVMAYSFIGILFALFSLLVSYIIYIVKSKKEISHGHKKYPYSR